jgi:CHAT domain-containing protein
MAGVVSSATSQQQNAQSGEPAQLVQARADLAAAEAAHPGNTPEVANALILLSQRQRVARRNIDESMALAKRAVAVSEAAKGPQSALYATALAEMAKVYLAMDHPEQGRPIAEQAMEIAQRAAPGTGDLAIVADALDKICMELGDYSCALRAAEVAVAAIRASHAENDLYLASMLQDLAQIRLKLHDPEGTRAEMEESLAIVDRQAKSAPSMAILESNAAQYFTMSGKPDEALLHLNKALELSKSIYGADSIQVGYATGNLAFFYAKAGRFNDARTEYDLSLALHRKWYGPTHTRTAGLENGYARMLMDSGQLSDAIDLALKAHQSLRENSSLAIRVLPEGQALDLIRNSANPLDVALSVVARHPEIGTARVYQEEIRSRALVAEEMAQRQVSLNRKDDPEVAAMLKELDSERTTALSARNSAQPGAGTSLTSDAALARMERIERTLAERSAAYRAGQRIRTVDLEDVRRNLPPKSVLVSFVLYNRSEVHAPTAPKAFLPFYMAFVLHPDSNKIQVFDLGEAKGIDDLVAKARAAADAEAHSGGMGSTRNERAYRDAALALRQRIWDPLKAELTNATLALVVADGSLNLIPFASLPDGTGYLVEHGPVIHMLTNERDLVPTDQGAKKIGLFAIGSPSFQLAENRLPPSPLRGEDPTCDEFSKIEFQPLPGTAIEVADIGSTWQRWNAAEPEQLVTGDDATLARFLSDSAHSRVLHVATHAFLLDKSCGNGNPLLHSGLVFAGGNHGGAQSIVTAQQIASLDLSGVDWAVLSACNTGNGELKDGEGIYGLQRAFRVAGAHSVIMTLWPVDDDAARQFMHELYAQRLGQHATTADAVWNSSRKILMERRVTGKSTNPWYWAGFVGSGGWE